MSLEIKNAQLTIDGINIASEAEVEMEVSVTGRDVTSEYTAAGIRYMQGEVGKVVLESAVFDKMNPVTQSFNDAQMAQPSYPREMKRKLVSKHLGGHQPKKLRNLKGRKAIATAVRGKKENPLLQLVPRLLEISKEMLNRPPAIIMVDGKLQPNPAHPHFQSSTSGREVIEKSNLEQVELTTRIPIVKDRQETSATTVVAMDYDEIERRIALDPRSRLDDLVEEIRAQDQDDEPPPRNRLED